MVLSSAEKLQIPWEPSVLEAQPRCPGGVLRRHENLDSMRLPHMARLAEDYSFSLVLGESLDVVYKS